VRDTVLGLPCRVMLIRVEFEEDLDLDAGIGGGSMGPVYRVGVAMVVGHTWGNVGRKKRSY